MAPDRRGRTGATGSVQFRVVSAATTVGAALRSSSADASPRPLTAEDPMTERLQQPSVPAIGRRAGGPARASGAHGRSLPYRP